MKDPQGDMLPYLKYLLVAAFKPSTLKLMVTGFLLFYGFFFDPNQAQAHISLFFLVLMDFTTGIGAAKATGEKIKSSKIRHTAIKMSAYFTMIAGSHLAESGLASHLQVLDDTVTAFLLTTELKSLLENFQRMGYETPKKLIDKLTDFTKSKR